MINFDYKNKVAVVTGGTSGIGLATVRILLKSGAKVAFCARSRERLLEVESKLKLEFSNDQVFAKALSVLDQNEVNKFSKDIESQFGKCDLLVNNAGQGMISTFNTTDDDDWKSEYELKIFSQIYPIRAFQSMLKKENGSVVVVNSLLAIQPEQHMVCTSSARAAVQNLIKSLSVEFAPQIRFNSILLGLIKTNQWESRFEDREDKSINRNDWYQNLALNKGIPLGRLGNPEEVASAIAFLGSSDSSYITGAQLEISGGLSKHI